MKRKPSTQPTNPQPAYRVLIGFNYGTPEQRHEPGDIMTELPAAVAAELLTHNPPAISPLAGEGV